jgi:hypothetical protein
MNTATQELIEWIIEQGKDDRGQLAELRDEALAELREAEDA